MREGERKRDMKPKKKENIEWESDSE